MAESNDRSDASATIDLVKAKDDKFHVPKVPDAQKSAFLNLRPPSDSPARANSRITFGIPPVVDRYSLPLPQLQEKDSEQETGDKKSGDDESCRKRPRAASPSRISQGRSISMTNQGQKESDAPVTQPGKKRNLAPVTESEFSVAIIHDCFDPITFAHLQLAAELIHNDVAHEVWLMPAAAKLDGSTKSTHTPCRERWLMCHLAVNSVFGSEFPIKVHAQAMDAALVTSRGDLLRALQQQHPQKSFRFVIGSDDLACAGNALARSTSGVSTPSSAAAADSSGIESAQSASKKGEGGGGAGTMAIPLVVVPQPGCPVSDAWARTQPDCIVFDSSVQGLQFPFSNVSSATVRQRAKLNACAAIGDVNIEAGSSIATLSTRIAAGDQLRTRLKRHLTKHKSLTRCEGLLPAAVLRHIEKYDLCKKYF